jgi:hypothetical protein
LEEFLGMLRKAFDDPGEGEASPAEGEQPEFHAWVSVVTQQIEDLRAMAKCGQLEDEFRYFGIDAPSGARWYNFDPYTYIECGAEGAFGGWQEEDTERTLVSGPVACLDADGNLVSRDPKDIQEPTAELPGITWEMLSDFIWCGQCYE